MSVTREQMAAEAVKRMKKLNIMEQTINEFQEGILNLSDNEGMLYLLDEEQKKIVADFEEENEGLVYHVIHSFTNIGEMYELLYVSTCDEEWEEDYEDLENGSALVYVINVYMPDCSELGTIGVKPMNGGVVRTW